MQFAANFTDTETVKHVVFKNPALIVYRARCFLGMSESAQRLLGPNMVGPIYKTPRLTSIW